MNKKRRCDKGKPCGITCISKWKKCVVDSQEAVSNGLNSVVKDIVSRRSREERRRLAISTIDSLKKEGSSLDALLGMMSKAVKEDPNVVNISRLLALRYLRREPARKAKEKERYEKLLLDNSPKHKTTPGSRGAMPELDKDKEIKFLTSELKKLDDKLKNLTPSSEEWMKVRQQRIAVNANRDMAIKYGVYVSPTLNRIYELQGYNAKPELVASRSDLGSRDDIIKHSDGRPLILYRGLSSEYNSDQLKGGDLHYPGRGVYGDGTYAASAPFSASSPEKGDKRAIDTAIEYAGGTYYKNNLNGKVTAFALRSDSVIVRNDTEQDFEKWSMKITKEASDKLSYMITDPGHAAAALGIHAYNIPMGREDYWVVLNRGAMIAAVNSQVEE